MKKIISVFISVVILVLFAACGNTEGIPFEPSDSFSISEPAPEVSSESAEPAPAPVAAGNPVDYEAVAAELNRALEENRADEIDRFGHFGNDFIFNDFDTLTIYRTTTLNGYNVIVLYLKDSGKYHIMNMDDYGLYTVRGIAPLNENPDIIKINAESRMFGGDYIFMNFPSEMYYSIPQGRITHIRYSPDVPGTYGMTSTRDWQRFDECTADGKKAVFTFKMVEGGNGNGYDGPAIITDVAPKYDSEKPSVFGFRDTELNLSADFIAKIQAMEGVASARFEYIKTGIFTGTQLTITPKPDYRVTCSIERSAQTPSPFGSFTVRCIRIRYDEPDFTDALGFKVILQNGPPMVGGELYGDYAADMEFQLDKTNIAHLRVAVDVGESIDAYDPRWFEFETKKEMDIDGVSVNICWNMSGPMSAAWNKNGYAMNFYMNEGESELSAESFQNFVEWCVKDVAIEPAVVVR